MIPALLFFSIFNLSSFATTQHPQCLTTREFITTLEFLRSYDPFSLKENEARDWALKASEGCTGAAKRFIRVAQIISKAGGERKISIDTALIFSKSTEAETEAFIQTLQTALAEDGLDMDLGNSLKIALSLSKEYAGDHEAVRKDFEKIAKFCSDTQKLGLTRHQCGVLAAAIARSGEVWKTGVAEAFIQNFDYLTSTKGPALIASDAVNLAEKMMGNGPQSPQNFQDAYQYATKKSGLGLDRKEAVAFALKMAAIPAEEIKSSEKPKNPVSGQ